MTRAISTKTLNPGSKLGRSIAQLLGPLPLLAGEDKAKFEVLQARITEAIKPRHAAIEEILTSDLVAHTWDVARLRRSRPPSCSPVRPLG